MSKPHGQWERELRSPSRGSGQPSSAQIRKRTSMIAMGPAMMPVSSVPWCPDNKRKGSATRRLVKIAQGPNLSLINQSESNLNKQENRNQVETCDASERTRSFEQTQENHSMSHFQSNKELPDDISGDDIEEDIAEDQQHISVKPTLQFVKLNGTEESITSVSIDAKEIVHMQRLQAEDISDEIAETFEDLQINEHSSCLSSDSETGSINDSSHSQASQEIRKPLNYTDPSTVTGAHSISESFDSHNDDDVQLQAKLENVAYESQRTDSSLEPSLNFKSSDHLSKPSSLIAGHTGSITCMILINQELFATGGEDKTICIYDTTTLAQTQRLGPLPAAIENMCIVPIVDIDSSGRNNLLTVAFQNCISIWSIHTWQQIHSFKAHSAYVWAATWLKPHLGEFGVLNQHKKNGGVLCSASADRAIKLWRIDHTAKYDKSLCIATLDGHKDSVYCLASITNGMLASGSTDTTVKIWSPFTSNSTITLRQHSSAVYHVCETAEQILISASMDSTICIWDISTRTCLNILRGHDAAVTSITFQHEHSLLFSGSTDGEVCIWNLTNHTLQHQFWASEVGVNVLIILPDRSLISGHDDGYLRHWNIDINL